MDLYNFCIGAQLVPSPEQFTHRIRDPLSAHRSESRPCLWLTVVQKRCTSGSVFVHLELEPCHLRIACRGSMVRDLAPEHAIVQTW